MNISLLITRSIAFTVIANVLAMIGQEGAIAAPGKQPCQRSAMNLPSESSSIVLIPKYGSFLIPTDFKPSKADLGRGAFFATVIQSSRDIEFLQCASRNRMIGAGHGTEPIVVEILGLDDTTLAPDQTGGEYERRTIKIAGTVGILAKSRVPEGYPSPGDEIIKVVFDNQQKYRIQISMNTFDRKARKYNEAVFNQIISSFSFSDQPQEGRSPTAQNPSENQSVADLPDGKYFYGATQDLNKLGAQFVTFKKTGNVVFGQQYVSNAGGSSCFIPNISQISRT